MLVGDVSVEVEVDGGDVEVVPAVLELDDVVVVVFRVAYDNLEMFI